jgi:hypothetical protein
MMMLAVSPSLRLPALLAGSVLSLVLLGSAHAGGGDKAGGRQPQRGGIAPAAGPTVPAATAGTVSAIQELTATVGLLQKADHDYDGHRLLAIRAILVAIQELQAQPAAPAGGSAKASRGGKEQAAAKEPREGKEHTAKEPAGGKEHDAGKSSEQGADHKREAQTVSDGQLKQALQQIRDAEGKVGSTHANAKAVLKTAIGELEAALKTR